MRIPHVLEQLDKHNEYTFYIGINDPQRVYTHKKVTYVYYDQEKKQVLLTRADVTPMYKEEERKQKQLKDALEGARKANNAKTDFLSRMSYDIRTPLNAIMGMTSIAERKINHKEHVLDCFAKINTASQYLFSLVNNILDFSAIEDNHVHIQSVSFNFKDFLQSITDIIQPQAIEQNVYFRAISL